MVLDLSNNYSKVSIQLSGGLDSSLLLYMLVKDNPDLMIYPLVMDVETGLSIAWSSAEKVLDFVLSALPNQIQAAKVTRINQDPWAGQHLSRANMLSVLECHVVYGTEANYHGVTLNPTRDQMQPDMPDAVWEDRDHRRDPLPYGLRYDEIDLSLGIKWHSPLRNLTKRAVHDLYEELGLLDTLAPLTESCHSRFAVTQNDGKPCGKCYWCYEKSWAFSESFSCTS